MSEPTMSDLLDAIDASALRLNAASTKAESSVAAVEARLNASSIGVTARVEFHVESIKPCPSADDGPPCPAFRTFYLCYGRLGEKYRVHVRETVSHLERDSYGNHDDEVVDDEIDTPWGSCPRDVKARSAPALPKLVKAIAEEADRMSEAVEATEVVQPPATTGGQPTLRNVPPPVRLLMTQRPPASE